ncbi:MAG TPA: hypothetical protein VH679_00425, partial [Vicinamibacterales bacterium]
MNLRTLGVVLGLGATAAAVRAGDTKRVPTIDDLLQVKSIGGAQISPDGRWVAYTVSETDFKQDAFVTQLWLASTATGRAFQLTRGDKPSGGPQWSPNGEWLAFTTSRVADRNQIFVIRPDGGEAQQLTKAETAVGGFAWSQDGSRIAFTASEPATPASKDRREAFSDFEVVRREYTHTHLWTFDVAEAMKAPVAGTQRTTGTGFSVGGAAWSPDGTRIAFSATKNPDLIQGETADLYLLTLADDSVKKIVAQPGPDSNPRWSPDGQQIVFSSYMGNRDYFASNARLAVIPAEGGTPRSITDRFDEQPGLVAWNTDGVYFSGAQRTASHLFRVDPATGTITRISGPDALMAGGFTLTRDGRSLAFTASSPTSLTEVFVTPTQTFTPKALTSMTDQASAFVLGTREVISWKSQDGTTIEGVLIKPADFDPAKKYPLLCVIHGGPTGIDRPALLAPDAR